MFRIALIGMLCIGCLASGPSLASGPAAPWVSCFADPPSDAWTGPKTVRTQIVKSTDGRQKAYAQIDAQAGGPAGCHNTVRLFVSTRRSTGFRKVYMEKASELGGNANSLGPVSWSPDGRWLLVEHATEYYASDAGGLDILLYDSAKRKVLTPNVSRMLQRLLKQPCEIRVGEPLRFDALSRVHLQLADYVEQGEDEPTTHCFHGSEEWAFDPLKGTLRFVTAGR